MLTFVGYVDMCIDMTGTSANLCCLPGMLSDAFKKGQAGSAHCKQLAYAHKQAHHECSNGALVQQLNCVGGGEGGCDRGGWQGDELGRKSTW